MRKITLSILFILWAALMSAQSLVGIIIDENGQPLSGANIQIISTNIYTVSDSDGSFIMEVEKASAGKLQISFVGYIRREITFSFKNDSLIDLGKIQMQVRMFETEVVSVIATRNSQLTMEVPADISIVSSKQMQLIPSDKIDQNLKFSSGVYLDRPFGIFGNSVIGLRSVVSSEPGRQLTLVDGVPINKLDGGGSNWNRLIESDFQRIEVLKGPGAAIYGNNAMGGAVNLVHKYPSKKGVEAFAKTSYSTYNTMSLDFSLMQKLSEKKQSFYYTLAGKALKSDSYITVPDSIRNEMDTNVFLNEYGINARVGYQFDASSHIELEYNYYDEYRGQGTKIRLEDGAVTQYKTNFSKLNYSGRIGKLQLNINGFYQLENYERDIEKMKKGSYTHIKVNSDRKDYGAMMFLDYQWQKHKISFSSDYRAGSVYGVDDYQTSTDKVINKGNLELWNFSLNDEWQLFAKFKAIIGLHYAYGHFYRGAFLLEESTTATSFMQAYSGDLAQKYWSGFSPRLALQYDFSKKMNLYAIYSHGYRAPSLDDITRYGFINIGYKKANPNLSPENLDNIEGGYRLQRNKWALQTNAYYSQGTNFMYYVATGETMFGGRKKVYEKKNVGWVNLYGAELNLDYVPSRIWRLNANYTLSSSEIMSFAERTDLEGKQLSYVPHDMANISAALLLKKLQLSLNIHYQGKMYLDEANEFEIDPLLSLDASVSYSFYRKFAIRLSGQNLLDEQHMLGNDQISLGRYLSISLQYGL